MNDGRYEEAKEGGYPYIQTRGYRAWKGIRRRDKVVPEWHDFDRFYADMGACPPSFFLFRPDPDQPWGPGNARWISQEERATKMNVKGGRPINPNSLAAKARKAGMGYHTFYMRKVRGWTEEDALTKPVLKYNEVPASAIRFD